MYALVEIQGKQYKAQEGAVLKVDKIDKETGATVEFDSVLMVADGEKTQIGTPYVKGAKVTAVLEDQIKDKKVVVFKFKRRKGYRRKQGHRQQYSQLLIKEINA